MRGYPLLQLFLVIGLFAAAGLPVWRVTRPAVAAPVAAATPPPVITAETPLDVRVTFAPAPTEFRLSYLGQTALAGRGPQAEFQGTVRVTVPPEGTDLALEAHFPAIPGATLPAAVRVRCQFPDGHATEKTLWSDTDHPLVDLVTVTP